MENKPDFHRRTVRIIDDYVIDFACELCLCEICKREVGNLATTCQMLLQEHPVCTELLCICCCFHVHVFCTRENGHRDKFRCYHRFDDQGRSSDNFENQLPDFRSCLMIDLGRQTDGNNEIWLGVRFALCIIKCSMTRSYWALFLGRWSPFSFILCACVLKIHVYAHVTSSVQKVLNPPLWHWGEQLQQREADQLVSLLKVSRLVTVDRQKVSSWRSTMSSRETIGNETNWSASRC